MAIACSIDLNGDQNYLTNPKTLAVLIDATTALLQGNVLSFGNQEPAVQKSIYEALPLNFETGDGIRIAEGYGMGERTFKRWLNSSLFKKIDHGYYEKKYR